MKKNQSNVTSMRSRLALGLWSVTALLIGLCGVALALNITASQGSDAPVSMVQGVTSRQAASIATAPRQANTTNNNADCLPAVKTNEIFGIRLFNPFARTENNTCPNGQVSADVPVAYPPTSSAQFERTSKTIKRGPQVPV